MKTLLTMFTLLFAIMIPSTSFAKWTRVAENDLNTFFYVDFTRIRKNNGYIYFWVLLDYSKPTIMNSLSHQIYHELDCSIFRYKRLTGHSYKEQMGLGDIHHKLRPHTEWQYPPPTSPYEIILNEVCSN
mgnify:CR=1 FL=1